MLKHEKLPSTNSIKSGTHSNFCKNQENEHAPVVDPGFPGEKRQPIMFNFLPKTEKDENLSGVGENL